MSDVESHDADRPRELREIRDSGVVAGRDVHLTGHLVAGRDIHYHAGDAGPVRPPSQLPPDIADFTGREPELRAARAILERPRRRRDTAAPVLAIAGRAGVGKTALATHLAHLVRRRFPDGQLYVDLGGAQGQLLAPSGVLERFLRALGVSGTAVPATLVERRDLFRTYVADRRVLVFLDNAAGEAQVQPLLPNSPGSAALVTSRVPLTGLEGVHPVRLNVLEPDQAIELLSKVAGPGRVTEADLEEAHLIVELCDRLPLAVRIAGAKLQARVHWSLEMLAERLIDEYTRLNELKIRDLEVRASFALTYEHLEPRERRAFRLLSLVKAPDFPGWVAAALLNTDLRQAEDLLDSLVEAQVLEVARQRPRRRAPDPAASLNRYRLHDLLRLFAQDRRWEEESPAAQEAALERAFDAYLALAGHAASLLEPGVETPSRRSAWVRTTAASVADLIAADPGGWFASEWVNLLGVVQDAHDHGIFDLTWELAGNLVHFCWLHNHWSDWERTQLLALDASRLAGKRDWEADALRLLGAAYQEMEEWRKAADRLGRSLAIAEELGNDRLTGWALLKLADLSTELNHYGRAVDQLSRCLAIFGDTGDPRGRAWARFQLGVIDRYQGRYTQAVDAFEQVLADFTAMRDQSGEAVTLLNLGMIEHARGELRRAHDHLAACLPIFDRLGDGRSAAYTLGHIGSVHHDIGISQGDPQRSREAIAYLRLGLGRFRQLRLQDGEAWTLLNIGAVYRDLGHFKEAAACFDRCLELCRALEDDQLAARANVAKGDLLERQGLFGKATVAYDTAAPVLHDKEDRLWEARLLRGRGLVAARQGQTSAAVAAWNESAELYRSLRAPAELEVSRLLAELEPRDQ